jgi:hypothetical protein
VNASHLVFARVRPRFGGDMRMPLIESLD